VSISLSTNLPHGVIYISLYVAEVRIRVTFHRTGGANPMFARLVSFLFCAVAWPYRLECRSQWPIGSRRGSQAARFLELGGSNSAWAWMSVSCECCVVRWTSLRRTSHSSIGVLSTVKRHCVCYKKRTPRPVALLRQKKYRLVFFICTCLVSVHTGARFFTTFINLRPSFL
jgi:hypothetical protein